MGGVKKKNAAITRALENHFNIEARNGYKSVLIKGEVSATAPIIRCARKGP